MPYFSNLPSSIQSLQDSTYWTKISPRIIVEAIQIPSSRLAPRRSSLQTSQAAPIVRFTMNALRLASRLAPRVLTRASAPTLPRISSSE
jgi:hypothetical protein